MQEMQETQVQSLGWEDPLEKGMATHSSICAWNIPWTESLVGYSPCGYKRIRHDLVKTTNLQVNKVHLFIYYKIKPGDVSRKPLFVTMFALFVCIIWPRFWRRKNLTELPSSHGHTKITIIYRATIYENNLKTSRGGFPQMEV